MAGERILVVDDNPINLKLVQLLLSRESYEVMTASDGESAIRMVDRFQPNVVLTDMRLPGMDGLELVRRIRSKPDHSNMVIVALTGQVMKDEEEQALRAGCDGYIANPLDTRSFLEAVRDYIGCRKPAAGIADFGNVRSAIAPSIIDVRALHDRVGGDVELIDEIVHIFFHHYPEVLGQARQAITMRDPRTLERTAHNLRGYFVNFHANHAADAALLLEIKGRCGDFEGAEEIFGMLEQEIEVLSPILESLMLPRAAAVSSKG